METRKADFAGSWYPANSKECERDIQDYLADPVIKEPEKKNYVAGIVPHAGWYFSGNVACNVIHSLKYEEIPEILVIFGMHLHENSARYIMKEGLWETPFGDVRIDTEISGKLVKKFPFQIETPNDYHKDNTIELQLPFIKYFFKDTRVVPIGVPPDRESIEVGRAVAEIAAETGMNVKAIGSTDLTHYGVNYGYMPHGSGPEAIDWVRNDNDPRIIDAMLAMDSVKVLLEAGENQNACCAGAVSAVMGFAEQSGVEKGQCLVYTNSYDKSPGNSFVGETE